MKEYEDQELLLETYWTNVRAPNTNSKPGITSFESIHEIGFLKAFEFFGPNLEHP